MRSYSIKRCLFDLCIALAFVLCTVNESKAIGPAGRTEAYDWDNQTLPEGCGNPFLDTHLFLQFYNATISSAVAKRGKDSKGISELFAVSEISNEMATLFPNFAEESPVDRLVISQLCQFQKARTPQVKPGETSKAIIRSSDLDLHAHFVSLAIPLFRDSRKLLVAALADRSAETRRAQYIAAKRDEILKARESGRRKIQDIFN